MLLETRVLSTFKLFINLFRFNLIVDLRKKINLTIIYNVHHSLITETNTANRHNIPIISYLKIINVLTYLNIGFELNY